MKVTEHIHQAQAPLFSFEVAPEFKEIENLVALKPAWVNVTSHGKNTFAFCDHLQEKYAIDSVAHMTWANFHTQIKVQNIFALQGENPTDKNLHASDLVTRIRNISPGTCIGVAGYPEKHFEAKTLEEDILNLKKKIDAGADYIITQMFFDNDFYFQFVDLCRKHKIHVPIIPGIKVLKSIDDLTLVPEKLHIEIPRELHTEMIQNKDHAMVIGKRWAQKQCRNLLEKKVPYLHFFVMNDFDLVSDITRDLKTGQRNHP